MEELYERVLAHLPTPQLHKSYNDVLRDELSSVSQALDDVLAAFAKLEEVRDAVSKLQKQSHDPPTGGRRDSSRTSADNAMELQQQLQRQVENPAAGMKVAKLKRKRVHEEAPTAPGGVHPVGFSGGEKAPSNGTINKVERMETAVDSDSENSEEAMGNTRRAQKSKRRKSVVVERKVAAAFDSASSSSSEPESGEDSDEVEGSEAAWKALMSKGALCAPSTEVKGGPDGVKKSETGNSAITQLLKKSATYWKTIVEEVGKLSPMSRSFIIPEVLAALKESVEADVDGSQQSEVACTLKILLGWGTHKREYDAECAGMYREYADAVEAYADRLPSSAQKDELKRLNGALSTTIKRLDGVVMSNTAKATREGSIREAKRTDAVSNVIGRPINGETRIGRLLRLLVAFKRESADPNDTFGNRMIKVVGTMSRWLSEDLHKPLFLALYRVVVNTLLKFSIRIPKVSKRDRVVGLLENMFDAISGSPNSKERLAKIHNRVTQLFEEVKQYQGKPILGLESKKLMDAIGILRNDVTTHIGMQQCAAVSRYSKIPYKLKTRPTSRHR
ncbi:hypothetical protein PHYSODRAFT_305025 [Phytophthora sojae]|uniref:Uncharacterized protein n=1 Tax=Phytophthora sojae (strain P6497) TaxID=1094619 RepID=G5A461_PHYSP|nr:hypothetical protein PHYSODRAFT_305025 [Phytophthora sojae]EGZ09507.1 hypothetical protein PHYSODRAFT_305025 [Phytophthora sojae]|eukprot:XP_009534368.1 hypothetical protein PHYSODRAFT_305025 [Phytophthora sojae]